MKRLCALAVLLACAGAARAEDGAVLTGTMKAIADGWNGITDELNRDKQLAAYKSTLGQ